VSIYGRSFTRMGIEGALATRRSSAASCANVPHKRVIASRGHAAWQSWNPANGIGQPSAGGNSCDAIETVACWRTLHRPSAATTGDVRRPR